MRASEEGKTMTFFFNNAPEDCSVDFLKRKFGTVKKVWEFFCPRKHDLKGRPLGFVRFKDVEDQQKLLLELNSLWIGNYKIRVYKPRFDRGTEGSQNGESEGRKEGGSIQIQQFLIPGRKIVEGVSFAEALTGRKKEVNHHQNPMMTTVDVQFQSTESEKEWLNGSFTGFIKAEFIWEEIKEEINNECAGKFKITSMGGNLVLIQKSGEESVRRVLEGLDEWSSFWFEWHRPWNYIDVNQQRIIWTRWIGVPLQAWSPRFFDVACAKLGMVLKIQDGTKFREVWMRH